MGSNNWFGILDLEYGISIIKNIGYRMQDPDPDFNIKLIYKMHYEVFIHVKDSTHMC